MAHSSRPWTEKWQIHQIISSRVYHHISAKYSCLKCGRSRVFLGIALITILKFAVHGEAPSMGTEGMQFRKLCEILACWAIHVKQNGIVILLIIIIIITRYCVYFCYTLDSLNLSVIRSHSMELCSSTERDANVATLAISYFLVCHQILQRHTTFEGTVPWQLLYHEISVLWQTYLEFQQRTCIHGDHGTPTLLILVILLKQNNTDICTKHCCRTVYGVYAFEGQTQKQPSMPQKLTRPIRYPLIRFSISNM